MNGLFKIIAIVLIFGTSACASTLRLKVQPVHIGVHPELKPYVEKFIDRSRGTVTELDMLDVTMGFNNFDKKSGIAGTCFISPFFREIDIDLNWWNENTNQMNREELLFHELGHCILYRMHTSPTKTRGLVSWFEGLLFDLGILEDKARMSDGCPISYMHPMVIGLYCIDKHYEYYMNEMYEKRGSLDGYGESKTFIRYNANECK